MIMYSIIIYFDMKYMTEQMHVPRTKKTGTVKYSLNIHQVKCLINVEAHKRNFFD